MIYTVSLTWPLCLNAHQLLSSPGLDSCAHHSSWGTKAHTAPLPALTLWLIPFSSHWLGPESISFQAHTQMPVSWKGFLPTNFVTTPLSLSWGPLPHALSFGCFWPSRVLMIFYHTRGVLCSSLSHLCLWEWNLVKGSIFFLTDSPFLEQTSHLVSTRMYDPWKSKPNRYE